MSLWRANRNGWQVMSRPCCLAGSTPDGGGDRRGAGGDGGGPGAQHGSPRLGAPAAVWRALRAVRLVSLAIVMPSQPCRTCASSSNGESPTLT